MGATRLNTSKFVEKSIQKHGNKYSYTKCIYVHYEKKVIITCSSHGDFEQTPNNHLLGSGCKLCGRKKLSDIFISNAENFISKANVAHHNRYDYSRVTYTGNKNKVEIICGVHGSFMQAPAGHLNGLGCSQCGGSYPLNNQSFIEKSNVVHGNKYYYELVDYKSNHTKIIIVCPKHGQFKQEPASHMGGQGCPKCGFNVSKPETEWLDSKNISHDHRHQVIKIGDNRFMVDAYDPSTNTIYEFNGDFWHGNPAKFSPNDINIRNKKSFGELYSATLAKEKALSTAGYKVISIWESDWKKEQKQCKQLVSAA